MKRKEYCDGEKSTIEMCLNCPFDDCIADFNKGVPSIKRLATAEYIIKRVFTSRKGKTKTSYVYTYCVGKVSSGTNINLAMKFTAEEVGEAVKQIKPYVSFQTELEIVKRSEELAEITRKRNAERERERKGISYVKALSETNAHIRRSDELSELTAERKADAASKSVAYERRDKDAKQN